MTAKAVEAVRVRVAEDAKADLTAIEGRKLRGTVVDAETKAPLAGVQIGCYGTARPRSGAACMSVRADAEGRFELVVPPGPTYVYLMDAGHIASSSERELVVPEDRDPDPVRLVGIATEPAERPVGKEKFAETRKAEMKMIDKRVVDEPRRVDGPVFSLRGRAVDPEGHPIAGARVYHNAGVFVESSTDRDGEFVLEGVPAGTIRITLDRREYRTAMVAVDTAAPPERYVLVPRPNADRKPTPAPPGLPARFAFVDLQPEANEPLDQGPGQNGDDLSELPLGVHDFGGTWFSTGPMMIHLRSSHPAGRRGGSGAGRRRSPP